MIPFSQWFAREDGQMMGSQAAPAQLFFDFMEGSKVEEMVHGHHASGYGDAVAIHHVKLKQR